MGDSQTRAGIPSRRRPPGRYGDPASASSRRSAYAVGAIVAVVALGALLALALSKSTPAVSGGLIGYRVLSDSTVQVRFEVHKAPLAEAVCTVRARDSSGRETGRHDVTVGPRRDSRRVSDVTDDLSTSARAVSGELVGCRITRDH